MTNRLRELLSSDQIVCGAFTTLADPAIVELVGYAGYDFTQLDLEHTGVSLETLENCLRAALAHRLGSWVRVPSLDPKMILRVLEIGADGVMVPDISTAEEAREAIRAMRFPPIGDRGFFASARAANYGAHGFASNEELADAMNRSVVFCCLIESREGVENCEEIIGTPGVDVVVIGVGDLSVSMGVSATPGHPDVTKAIKRIAAACEKAGIKLGLPINHRSHPLTPADAYDLGARVLLSGMDRVLLLQGYKAACASLRAVSAPA